MKILCIAVQAESFQPHEVHADFYFHSIVFLFCVRSSICLGCIFCILYSSMCVCVWSIFMHLYSKCGFPHTPTTANRVTHFDPN